MTQRYLFRFIAVLAIIIAAAWVVLPDNPGLHIGPLDRDIRVVQGLDLQGGLRVLLEADLPEDTEIGSEQLETARNIVENRVNGLGVSEPVVQVAGNRRILVELPGVEDHQEAIDTIQETGLLEFVDLDSPDPVAVAAMIGSTIETDFGRSGASEPQEDPVSESEKIYHTVMTGADLQSASVQSNPVTGEYLVQFDLTSRGQEIFGEYTSTHLGEPLAIVLDHQIISAPRIEQPITGGQGTITGSFTFEEANQLAIQLRYGSLPIPLEVVEIKSVGPTLGQDSLQKSAVAGVVGLAIVMAFMALYYRLPGLIADAALLAYATITFALFKLIPVTLTLPAIAGFVLSIGVAVDANILIFERMKEELRAGKSLRQSIELGFSRAWPSIRDSNLSTLITCAILFWFGNTFGASIVKGFALTLAIGVGVSLFTAITATRSFLHLVLDNLELRTRETWFGI